MRSVLSRHMPFSRPSFPRNLKPTLKLLLPAVVALVLALAQAVPAAACGGLIAPNGAVRLERATTLVAWHDGVEHYLTTFTYQGDVASVGYIVPLPAAPIQQVQEGGAWTLQRLELEAHPLPKGVFASAAAPTAADGGVQVLQQEQIEALDIAVIKGDSADDIIHWALDNGFALDGETRGHLQVYSSVTPYFMAAKYDTSAAQARHQLTGDGTPILVTMKTAHPWVPFEVLALDGQQVQADLFLLMDGPVYTSDLGAQVGQSSVGTEIPGAPGFQLAFQEPMNDSLYHDLSTDRNMSWIPRNSWLTYLTLDAPEDEVTYDLGVSSQNVVRVAPFGTARWPSPTSARIPPLAGCRVCRWARPRSRSASRCCWESLASSCCSCAPAFAYSSGSLTRRLRRCRIKPSQYSRLRFDGLGRTTAPLREPRSRGALCCPPFCLLLSLRCRRTRKSVEWHEVGAAYAACDALSEAPQTCGEMCGGGSIENLPTIHGHILADVAIVYDAVMKLGEYAGRMGVRYTTAWRWRRAGRLDADQADTGTVIVRELTGQEAPVAEKRKQEVVEDATR